MKTKLLKQFCDLLHVTMKDIDIVFYAEENLLSMWLYCLIRSHITGKYVLVMITAQDLKNGLLTFSDMYDFDTAEAAYKKICNLLELE